jgi:hypothetical protein
VHDGLLPRMRVGLQLRSRYRHGRERELLRGRLCRRARYVSERVDGMRWDWRVHLLALATRNGVRQRGSGVRRHEHGLPSELQLGYRMPSRLLLQRRRDVRRADRHRCGV